MGVRPLNGLVSIRECTSRFEADATVARLAAAGIEAMVLADPAGSVAPHLVTDRSFSVLVRVAIADDAQQALVWGAPPPGPPAQSPLVHPALRPRPDLPPGPPPAPGSPPTPPSAVPPTTAGAPAGPARRTDADHLHHADGLDDVDDADGGQRSGVRPGWVKVVAWVMAASVLLPLLLSALRAVTQL